MLTTVIMLAGLAPLLLGAWLVWSSFVRIGSRPHCRKCNYDVAIQIKTARPNAKPICPECGQDLRVARQVVRGQRSIKPWRMILGTTLILAVTVTGLWRLNGAWTWLDLMPNAYLTYLTRVATADEAISAYRELDERWRTGSVSSHDLVEAGLNLHGRLPHNHPAWIKVRSWGRALTAGETTDQQWQQLANQAFAAFKIDVRRSTRAGHGVPWRLEGFHCTPSPLISFLMVDQVTINGKVFPLQTLLARLAWGPPPKILIGELPPRLDEPGEYDYTVRFRLVFDPKRVRGIGYSFQDTQVQSDPIEKSLRIRVFENKRLVVTEDTSEIEQLRAIRLGQASIRDGQLALSVQPPTGFSIPIAFQVYTDCGGGLRPVVRRTLNLPARILYHPDTSTEHLQTLGACEGGFGSELPTHVTILLASSASVAPRKMAPQIWEGGLLFQDVPLEFGEHEVVPEVLSPGEVAQRIND